MVFGSTATGAALTHLHWHDPSRGGAVTHLALQKRHGLGKEDKREKKDQEVVTRDLLQGHLWKRKLLHTAAIFGNSRNNVICKGNTWEGGREGGNKVERPWHRQY